MRWKGLFAGLAASRNSLPSYVQLMRHTRRSRRCDPDLMTSTPSRAYRYLKVRPMTLICVSTRLDRKWTCKAVLKLCRDVAHVDPCISTQYCHVVNHHHQNRILKFPR